MIRHLDMCVYLSFIIQQISCGITLGLLLKITFDNLRCLLLNSRIVGLPYGLMLNKINNMTHVRKIGKFKLIYLIVRIQLAIFLLE